MGAQRIQYKITRRLMYGREAIGYECVSDKGKYSNFTREQICYLAGRDQLINAKAILSQDDVILSGVGCELSKLPTIQVTLHKSTTNNEVNNKSNKAVLHYAESIVNYINEYNKYGIKASLETKTESQKVIMLMLEGVRNNFAEIFIDKESIKYAVWRGRNLKPIKTLDNVKLQNEKEIFYIVEQAYRDLM